MSHHIVPLLHGDSCPIAFYAQGRDLYLSIVITLYLLFYKRICLAEREMTQACHSEDEKKKTKHTCLIDGRVILLLTLGRTGILPAVNYDNEGWQTDACKTLAGYGSTNVTIYRPLSLQQRLLSRRRLTLFLPRNIRSRQTSGEQAGAQPTDADGGRT